MTRAMRSPVIDGPLQCQQDEVKIAPNLPSTISAMYVVGRLRLPIRRNLWLVDFFDGIMAPAGKRLESTPTTTSSAPLPTPSRPCRWGSATWMPRCAAWAGAGTAPWRNLLGFLNPRYAEPHAPLYPPVHVPPPASWFHWTTTSPVVTGLTNQHPRTAIAAIKHGDTNFADFYQMLLDCILLISLRGRLSVRPRRRVCRPIDRRSAPGRAAPPSGVLGKSGKTPIFRQNIFRFCRKAAAFCRHFRYNLYISSHLTL